MGLYHASSDGSMNVSSDWLQVPTHPHWLQYPEITPEARYFIGSILVIVGVAGVLGNGLVLIVFTRFRRLRGPFSCFIVNLAVADFITSALHAMAAASSFKGHWMFGKTGCMLYACGVGYFGLLSIVTLSAIAVERYMVITAKPVSGSWKMTQYGARKVCVGAWIYCLLMALPPLFGWSSYLAEGFLTSCSWDYLTRTASNRSYYVYLLFLGFVLPVSVIVFCYSFIMAAIYAHGREMVGVKATGGGSKYGSTPRFPTTRDQLPRAPPLANAFRTAYIIIMLVALFLVSWTPYTVVTLVAQFGDASLVTPWIATLPALFAKASVVYNPIVYGLSHPHFRSTVVQYLSTCKTGHILPSTSAAAALTQAHSLRRHPTVPAVRHALCSSPENIGGQRRDAHKAHYRCFPHHNRDGSVDFYSDPEQPARPTVNCIVRYTECAGRHVYCVSKLQTDMDLADRPIHDLV